jgi:uncharacterized protein YycO
MAETISTRELKQLPIDSYTQRRSKLRSGDLLFASGNYPVSRAIRKMTGSAWSHVGIIFWLKSIKRVLLLESVESVGVRFAPLSKYLSDYSRGKPYKGMAILARCSNAAAKNVDDLARCGVDELTRPYDKNEIAAIVARIALGKGKPKRDREYICSELVHECFANAGKDFAYNPRGFISPEDIWRDAHVKLMSRIL